MKKLKLGILFIAVALSIAAAGSAALSSLSFDRSMTARVLVDTDNNVAVQFTNISRYSRLVSTGNDGKVTFNLNEAINNNSNNGFNKDAVFSIGTQSNGVVKIKNNSDIPVTVSTKGNSAIAILPANYAGATIQAGQAADFYFTVDTSEKSAESSINAVIHVEGK